MLPWKLWLSFVAIIIRTHLHTSTASIFARAARVSPAVSNRAFCSGSATERKADATVFLDVILGMFILGATVRPFAEYEANRRPAPTMKGSVSDLIPFISVKNTPSKV